MLISKAAVSDAFRNVRVGPDRAHHFFHPVGELVVIYFGWDHRSF